MGDNTSLQARVVVATVCLKNKTIDESRPIYKMLSLSNSCRNFVHKYCKDSQPHLNYVSTLPCETLKLQLLPISMAYCTCDLRIYPARYESMDDCNIRRSRLSLMKLAPVNGVNFASLCLYQRWTFSSLCSTFRLFIR